MVGRARHVPHGDRPVAAEVLRARHVPLPLRRRSPRGPSEGLHRHRLHGALQAHARLQRPAPHGLGRLRPARRAVRREDRHPPARDHEAQHRELQAPDPLARLQLRLVARDRHHRPGLREVDPVDLPAAPRARPRLPGRGARELVPRARHRARERGGDRRQERGGRPPRGAAPHAPVDAQDHRVRRPPARGPGGARLARGHQEDAARLDRQERGCAHRLRRRGPPGRDDRGVHHAPRHAARRDLHGARARAPARGEDHPRGAPGPGAGLRASARASACARRTWARRRASSPAPTPCTP